MWSVGTSGPATAPLLPKEMVSLRWLWRRHRSDQELSGQESSWRPPAPIPDHDRVFPQRRLGQPFWSPLAGEWINEPTQPLPLVDRPLLTRGQAWRAGGGGR